MGSWEFGETKIWPTEYARQYGVQLCLIPLLSDPFCTLSRHDLPVPLIIRLFNFIYGDFMPLIICLNITLRV